MKKKEISLGTIFKSGIWYTVAIFLANGMSIITTPIFTRVLTIEEYGLYSNFAAVWSLLTVSVTLNLHTTIARAQYDFRDDIDTYNSTILLTSVFTALVFGALGWIFLSWVTGILHIDAFSFMVMSISLIMYPPMIVFQTWERIKYNYRISVMISLSVAVGGVVFSLLFVHFFQNKLHGRILGLQLFQILAGAILLVWFFQKSIRFKRTYCKYALKIALPFVPHLISLYLLSVLDKIMITDICGSQSNALYSIAVSCGSIITMLSNALSDAINPFLIDLQHEKKYSNIRKFSYYYTGVVVLAVVGIFMITPEIIFVLGGDQYSEAIYIVFPIIVGCFCKFLYSLYVSVEQYEKKTIGMAIGSIICAGFNYVSNLVFIPIFGYIAAAYTTFASYLLLLIIHCYLVRRIKKRRIYNDAYIFGMVGACFGLGLLCTTTYKYQYFRVTMLCIYIIISVTLCVITYKNRSEIKKQISF